MHLVDPLFLDPRIHRFSYQGKELGNVREAYRFQNGYADYLHFIFKNGREADHQTSEVRITINALGDKEAADVLDYLKQAAGFISVRGEEGNVILSDQYEKIQFVDKKTAAASYLNPENYNIWDCREKEKNTD